MDFSKILASWILSNALFLGLVASRVSGFVVASPFPGADVPKSVRAGLVCLLTYVSAAAARPPTGVLKIDAGLFMKAGTELAFGVSIALVLRLFLSAAEVAGELVSQGTGLSSASLLNPTLGVEETALSRVITFFALLLALSSGAHRVVLAYLITSFDAIPVGGDLHVSGATPLIAELAGQSIAVGLRLALPVVGVTLAVQLALAFVSRIAPSLQIFNIGFAILITTGLLTFGASLNDITAWLLEHLAGIAPAMERLLLSVSS